MIALLARLAINLRVPEKLSRLFAWVFIVLVTGAVLWGGYALIWGKGEMAGTAKVTAQVEKQHTATVADARTDERHAQAVTDRIADRTVRADAATDAYVRSTIEDLRNALSAQQAAPAGAAPAAAPVASMSASLNDLIDRANRAAEDPGTVP